ncbi:hypothetical protein J2S59_001587 [Nocardioides massiliensis]|uniref:Uncharacterized protein n=1 Tax=Nocardioides massiliensis TaxID=1325935 RepID=A0ABT9NN16_9ACTN|nr:hypothetical protein [Nocardioides massiliensis]
MVPYAMATTSPAWRPLPPEIAEWMGMDEAMVPFALAVARGRPRQLDACEADTRRCSASHVSSP